MLHLIDLGLWHCEPGKYYERLPRWRYNVHAHGISRMVWQRPRCRKTEWIHGKILTILNNSKPLSGEAFIPERRFLLLVIPILTFLPSKTNLQARSRNLMRVSDPTKRKTYLRQGKLAICAFLAELPKSEHDITSFTLDVPFATERLMSFTVSGIFREPENEGGPSGQVIRHFNRVFVVVPQGQGFCIVNDMLYITIPTNYQKKVKELVSN